MHRRFAVAITLLALVLSAVAPGALTPPQEEQKPKQSEQASAPRPESPLGQPINIRLDLTITDQTGSGEPLRKVVTMVIADRGTGSIRSIGSIGTQGRVQINVDARPQILQSGGVRLSLGLEYNPRTLGNDAPTEWSSLNEQIQAVVEPGKTLVISQAADPASERKITVEVKATVLK